MVEHSAVNRVVVGSSPTRGVFYSKKIGYNGSMVKRLRHRPFTAVTRVRFPSESLEKYADVAQLAEQLICNQQVIGSSPIIGFFEGTRVLEQGPLAQLVRAPPCHGGGRGFESRLGRSGSLAQLGEHLPYKQRVTGSSPVTSTFF